MVVQLRFLKKVALGGGFICLGTGLIIQNIMQNRCKKTEFYGKCLTEFRNNKNVVQIFGEPIKDLKIDLGDNDNNVVTEREAKLAVPVKGPKERGKLFLWASKDQVKCQWQVDRLELQLKDDKTKRLLVYDRHKNIITNNK